jgi:hypothetical protein
VICLCHLLDLNSGLFPGFELSQEVDPVFHGHRRDWLAGRSPDLLVDVRPPVGDRLSRVTSNETMARPPGGSGHSSSR